MLAFFSLIFGYSKFPLCNIWTFSYFPQENTNIHDAAYLIIVWIFDRLPFFVCAGYAVRFRWNFSNTNGTTSTWLHSSEMAIDTLTPSNNVVAEWKKKERKKNSFISNRVIFMPSWSMRFYVCSLCVMVILSLKVSRWHSFYAPLANGNKIWIS